MWVGIRFRRTDKGWKELLDCALLSHLPDIRYVKSKRFCDGTK
jgi:hypothetical protein